FVQLQSSSPLLPHCPVPRSLPLLRRPQPRSSLFPYTTLFRSKVQAEGISLGQRLSLVAAGFHYQNKIDSLGNKLAQALYLRTAPDDERGRVLYASISQLQDFYINQYEYFLKYGLRLQKRDELTLSNDRIGTFFHKAMETF